MQDFQHSLKVVKQRIHAAAARSGRSGDAISLIAVSKTHPPEVIQQAMEAGQTVFGENRVQELLSKSALLPSSLHWHLIGHLQSNKIRKVLPVCELIHSVDSLDLAQDIDRIAADLDLFPRVLLEVNVSGETSKFGFPPETLLKELPSLLTLPRLSIEGLMTVAPHVENPGDVRPVFRDLRLLRERCEAEGATNLPCLSMGMTNDFEVAIEEGATHVRIGSALFGAR
ncbi:MAG: YggS family pyridoxal phosphate-dependent enzyme [Terrimicrobiaceae bacterium]